MSEPVLRRHADHDPALICRPALGYGLCEVLGDEERREEGGMIAPDDPSLFWAGQSEEGDDAIRCGMGGANYDGASSVEWWTPPGVFTALGVEFDLDPCAPPAPAMPWLPARHRISLPQDGLTCPWEGRVWLNPPYGTQTGRWTDRLAVHGNGIALVFARTDTAWGQRALRAASAVCFIDGRLSFIDGERPASRRGHNAAAASVLLAYGPGCAESVLRCGLGVAYQAPVLPVQEEPDVLFDLRLVSRPAPGGTHG